MNTSDFLVGWIGPESTTGDLDWVVTDRAPYNAIDPIDLDESLLDSVYEMYTQIYGKISPGLNIPDRDGLFEYNRWILIRDDAENLVGFVLLKTTSFGLKTGLTASDGSKTGKNAIKSFHREIYKVAGVYAEVSDAMERLVADLVPWVTADNAEIVLTPKDVEKDPDGYHYKRNITGIGTRKKLMVGNPKITPDS